MNPARITQSIDNLHEAMKQVLIISNNMAKDVPGRKMVVLKEVTREEYDLSGQNPLVNFRTAVKEIVKTEKELQREEDYTSNKYLTRMTGTETEAEEEVDTIPYFSEGLPGKAPPCKFTVKQVKKELQEYCDEMGIPTGKRGVFKPFIPSFTQCKTHYDLSIHMASTHEMLTIAGSL